MNHQMIRKVGLLAASLAVAAGVMAACSTTEKDKPTESPVAPSSTSGAPATPTEKRAGPGTGGNSFTPSVTARPAPTALPGNVVTGG